MHNHNVEERICNRKFWAEWGSIPFAVKLQTPNEVVLTNFAVQK
jgi:hypothetical protein